MSKRRNAMSEPAFFEHADRRQDLVSSKRLVERLGRPDIAVVDASVSKRLENDDIWLSDRAAFEAGHIPVARFAVLVSDFSDLEERFAFTRPTASRLERPGFFVDQDEVLAIVEGPSLKSYGLSGASSPASPLGRRSIFSTRALPQSISSAIRRALPITSRSIATRQSCRRLSSLAGH
jgi:hypothetical protein